MQYIKTFESFNSDPDHDPMLAAENKPVTYILFITNQPGQDLEGEVRSEDGKTICSVDQAFIDDGIMQHASDLSGLRSYLTDKKKMKQQDMLTMDGFKENIGQEMGTSSGHSVSQLTVPIV